MEKTLEDRIVGDVPERLIGDKAHESDRLDDTLMRNYGYGAKMIALNREKYRLNIP